MLDLRAGTLTRNADWESPTGGRVRVRSRRLVSLTQRAVAAIEYVVEAVGQTLRLIVQSELVANEPTPPRSGDPREAAVSEDPLSVVKAQRLEDALLQLVGQPLAGDPLDVQAGQDVVGVAVGELCPGGEQWLVVGGDGDQLLGRKRRGGSGRSSV